MDKAEGICSTIYLFNEVPLSDSAGESKQPERQKVISQLIMPDNHMCWGNIFVIHITV